MSENSNALWGHYLPNVFLEHFHTERNHQGLANRVIDPGEEVNRRDGEVLCRERLGGMLRYYYRKAA